MSKIRVTYSGLFSFVIGLFSVATGLIFTLIITRSLSPEELGTWSLIGGLTVYVLILEPLIAYWATRESARGEKSGKTAIISSSIFSIVSIIAFLIIAFFVDKEVEVEQNILFMGVILIPFMFMRRTLIAINLGHKPHIGAISLLIFEVVKVPLAIFLIYYYEMGVQGAIIAIAAASAMSSCVLAAYSWEKIKVKFSLNHLKKWLKLSWIPTYPQIGKVIMNLDILAFTIIIGSVEGLAFWTVAITIANVVQHSERISKAVYPKLLEGGEKKHLQENLNLLFYFMIPLFALSITFAKPGLFALNPIYEIAVPIILIMALVRLLRTFNNIFTNSLTGIDKVDTRENSTFKEYLKSSLFFLPTVSIIQKSVYLSTLVIVLLVFKNSVDSQIDLVIYWAMVSLFTLLPFTIFLYVLVRKQFPLQINIKRIGKYIFTAIGVFGITFVLMEEYLIYKSEIFEFLPNLLIFVIIGISGYLSITYLVDKKTRYLVTSVINELRSK